MYKLLLKYGPQCLLGTCLWYIGCWSLQSITVWSAVYGIGLKTSSGKYMYLWLVPILINDHIRRFMILLWIAEVTSYVPIMNKLDMKALWACLECRHCLSMLHMANLPKQVLCTKKWWTGLRRSKYRYVTYVVLLFALYHFCMCFTFYSGIIGVFCWAFKLYPRKIRESRKK
jgi:hypothetical protein